MEEIALVTLVVAISFMRSQARFYRARSQALMDLMHGIVLDPHGRSRRRLRARILAGSDRDTLNLMRMLIETLSTRLPKTELYHSYKLFDLFGPVADDRYFDALVEIRMPTPKLFYSHLRMTKQTFVSLVELLTPHMAIDDDEFSPSVKILIALWRLATGDSYRSISTNSGFPKTYCFSFTLQVCQAITMVIPQYVYVPLEGSDERADVMDQFYEASVLKAAEVNGAVLYDPEDDDRIGWNGILGAVDGCLVELKRPFPGTNRAYFSRKATPSLNIQALTSYNCQFLHVTVGWPGSVHDARVYRNSALVRDGNPALAGSLIGDDVIIADSAYPAAAHCVPAFKLAYAPQGEVRRRQRQFNTILSSLRQCVERTFGIWKKMWRGINPLDATVPKYAHMYVLATIFLHNYCLKHDDAYRQENMQFDPPENPEPQEEELAIGAEEENAYTRGAKRRMIACHLLQCNADSVDPPR